MSTSVKDTHKVRNIVTVILSIILVLTLTPLAAHAKSSSKAVCRIGSTTYTSIDKAFKAAKSGDTIVLIDDTSNGYVNVNTNCTLDLNGHTLKRSGWTAFYPYSFYVQDNISFTITDSSSNGTGVLDGKGGVECEDSGAMFTLEKGTLQCSATGVEMIDTDTYFIMNGGTISAYTGVFLNKDDTFFRMNGGTIKANDIGISTCGSLKDAKTYSQMYVIINDGTITSERTGIRGQALGAKFEIRGGTIEGKKYGIFAGVTEARGGSDPRKITQFHTSGECQTYEIGNATIKSQGIGIYNFARGIQVSLSSGATVEAKSYGLKLNAGLAPVQLTANNATVTSATTSALFLGGSSYQSNLLEIKSGTFNSGANVNTDIEFYSSFLKETSHIYGGTFSKAPECVADDYRSVQNANGTYTVCPSECTVTLDANAGTLSGASTQAVDSGQTIPAPANPVREGYTFTGWTTDKAGNNPFNMQTVLTGDITLYAQWAEAPDEEAAEADAAATTTDEEATDAAATTDEEATDSAAAATEEATSSDSAATTTDGADKAAEAAESNDHQFDQPSAADAANSQADEKANATDTPSATTSEEAGDQAASSADVSASATDAEATDTSASENNASATEDDSSSKAEDATTASNGSFFGFPSFSSIFGKAA